MISLTTITRIMPRSALWTVADLLADECRASPDGGHWPGPYACDNFLHGFKSAPAGAPARRRREPVS